MAQKCKIASKMWYCRHGNVGDRVLLAQIIMTKFFLKELYKATLRNLQPEIGFETGRHYHYQKKSHRETTVGFRS